MQNPLQTHPSIPAKHPPLLPWLVTLWPAIVTVLGMLYLHEAVAESVKTTPHPILLLAILVGTLVSWTAIVLAQWRCTKEVGLAQRWSPGKAATDPALQTQATQSVFAPVYQLLSGHSTPPNPQQALQDEWANGESTLQGLLEFATFMGNALVGMGLVGTFVGLLGSLRDLSSVFNALIDGGGNSVSPTALFTDMITRLQLPMRAMGTAFVASLYGLLGSLVVSLMMVGARKSIARSAHVIHQLVLGHTYQPGPDAAQSGTTAPLATDLLATELLATDIAGLKQDISALQQARQQTRDNLQALHTEFQSLTAVNLLNLQQTEETHPPLIQLGQAVQNLTSQLQALHTDAQRDAQLHTRQLGESMQALAQQLLTQQAQSQQEAAQHSQRYQDALQSVTDLLQAQQNQTRQQADHTSQQFSQALQSLTQQLHSQQEEAQQVAAQSSQQFSQALHTLTEQLHRQQTQAQQETNLTRQQLHQSLQTLAEQLHALHDQAHQEARLASHNLGQALHTLAQQLQAQQTQTRQEAQHSGQHLGTALETLARQLQSQQAQLEQEAQQEAQHYRQHLSQTMAKVGQLLALNNQGQLAAQNELLSSFQRLEELQREQLAESLRVQQNSQARLNQLLHSIAEAQRQAKQKNEDLQAPASSALTALSALTDSVDPSDSPDPPHPALPPTPH